MYGGTAAGLETFLRIGHYIQTYAWADTNPDAHTATKHRLAQLHQQYPTQLPLTSTNQWDTLLPLAPTLLTPNNIAATCTEGIDILIAGLPTYTPTTAKKHLIANPHEQALQHIIKLTLSMYNTQTNKHGYLLINTPSAMLHPHNQD